MTSFEDVKTVDGLLYDTLRDATRTMGLLEDDAEHHIVCKRLHK